MQESDIVDHLVAAHLIRSFSTTGVRNFTDVKSLKP